jgi:hypothetical protein
MSDPIGPVSRAPRPRRVARRAFLPVLKAALASDDEAGLKTGPAGEPQAADGVARADVAAFAAQVMGQGGQKRGLRGGPETLDHARHSYLETEWSGGADRRIRRGRIAKREI